MNFFLFLQLSNLVLEALDLLLMLIALLSALPLKHLSLVAHISDLRLEALQAVPNFLLLLLKQPKFFLFAVPVDQTLKPHQLSFFLVDPLLKGHEVVLDLV